MSEYTKIVVCGAGVMGYSLAVLHALDAEELWLTDISRQALDKALPLVRDALHTLQQCGMLTEPAERILERIHVSDSLSDCLQDVDLVVEAVSENAAIKRQFLAGLVTPAGGGPGLPAHALVASNTSSLDIFSLAPDELLPRLYAAHHFVPAHVVPLVEIVGSAVCSEEATERLLRHYRAAGAVPVLMKRFCPGFAVNRLQVAIHQEMFRLLEEDIIDPAMLDLAVKASFGVRLPVLGILKRLDFAGLDLVLGNMERLGKTAAPAALRERVACGKLGIKSGAGFYDYGGRSEADICRERDERMLAVRSLLGTSGLLSPEPHTPGDAA